MADDEMVTWLSATLDKLAFEAEEAAEVGGYEWDSFAAEPGYGAYVHAHGKSLAQGTIVEATGPLAVDHIALNDPRAVLARLAAERMILNSVRAIPMADSILDELAWGHRFDFPGYRDEWAPDA